MVDRNQIHEGMVVRTSDGKKLGRVLACEDAGFTVEKGFFFATDYVARYGEVKDTSGDEVRLSQPAEALAHSEHVYAREGGLGESFTVGMGGRAATQPWARAGEGLDEGRGAMRGDEEEPGRRSSRGEPGCYGDEGGGGLL